MRSLMTHQGFPTVLDGFFEDFFRPTTTQGAHTPAVEVRSSDSSYEVRAAIPGVNPDSLNVEVKDGYLALSGKYEQAADQAGDGTEFKVAYSELHGRTEFSRKLRLDETRLDAERVEARLENGILVVTIPVKEAAKPRQIEVRVD